MILVLDFLKLILLMWVIYWQAIFYTYVNLTIFSDHLIANIVIVKTPVLIMNISHPILLFILFF